MTARLRLTLWLFSIAILLAEPCRAENEGGPLRLTLPAECYAVPDVEFCIYYDNIVLTETPEAFHFRVTCDIGESEARRWRVTPVPADVGDHPLSVTVTDADGKSLGAAEMVLRVTKSDAGADRPIRLLIVGDSLTHATHYPNHIAELLSRPGNPQWTMLGTHRPTAAKTGVAHEGYGGWTWQRFAAHHEPNPDGTYRKRSSPFVYLDKTGKPQLDPRQYFEKECGGKPADVIVFMLGINDCFSFNPDDPKSLESGISAVFEHAETLLAAFHKAAPHAKLGICLTPSPNARESSFQANYKGKYPRWGWKRIQHRLVQLQLSQFKGREQEQVFIVPTQLNIDPVDGYPTNNSVHPNPLGYGQIGAEIFAWLKAELAADARQ